MNEEENETKAENRQPEERDRQRNMRGGRREVTWVEDGIQLSLFHEDPFSGRGTAKRHS